MGDSVGILDEQMNTSRAVIYRFLSQRFSHPDRALIELFNSARLEEFLQAWCCLCLDSSEDIDKVAGWLAKWPRQEAALLELEKEYTRLFITAYPRAVAPPYSSLYLDSERLIWGSSTAEVAKMYEATGLTMSESFHDIPDHIAAELEFASYLIAEQLKGDEQGSPSTERLVSFEKRLLTEHLHKWAPAFFKQVAEYPTATFYGMIAEVASRFIVWDIAYIKYGT